jgi:cytidylate kinase
MIIAIDGPAASGKGTLARRLAAEYALAYLDTGLLYRAIAKRLVDDGVDPANEAAAIAAAQSLGLSDLEASDLRSEIIGEIASRIAPLAAVRTELVRFQRNFAHNPPNGEGGAVLDGRDIGTVICPDADVKFYIVAAIEERARRRHAELRERGYAIELGDVTDELRRRDTRDSERSVSPLRQAPGAHLLDTSNLSIDSAFAKAKALISKHFAEFKPRVTTVHRPMDAEARRSSGEHERTRLEKRRKTRKETT